MNSSPESLRHLEIPNLARFETGNGGFTRLVLNTPGSEAHIYLHGAHVTHFQLGEKPVLFMSRESLFEADKPIRGGVPVIFPWFGPREGHPKAPAHGFARTMPWEVESIEASAGDSVTATLSLKASEQTRAQWPGEFILRYRVTLRTQLEMALEVENTGSESFVFEEALHTYFAVGDAREVRISGLAGCEYIDKVDGFQRKIQDSSPIQFTGETDRVYLHTQATCGIDDPISKRTIKVSKSGSNTTVVWNPWIAKATAMADFGDEEWPMMACVETANAGEDRISLPPGGKALMTAVVAVNSTK